MSFVMPLSVDIFWPASHTTPPSKYAAAFGVYMCSWKNIYTHTHTHKQTNIHTCIHTYIPTYLHTYIHIISFAYTSIELGGSAAFCSLLSCAWRHERVTGLAQIIFSLVNGSDNFLTGLKSHWVNGSDNFLNRSLVWHLLVKLVQVSRKHGHLLEIRWGDRCGQQSCEVCICMTVHKPEARQLVENWLANLVLMICHQQLLKNYLKQSGSETLPWSHFPPWHRSLRAPVPWTVRSKLWKRSTLVEAPPWVQWTKKQARLRASAFCPNQCNPVRKQDKFPSLSKTTDDASLGSLIPNPAWHGPALAEQFPRCSEDMPPMVGGPSLPRCKWH